jgi:putative ubiquitin-RnfH superfamily antitoxin RatB of RatAB toxin-antitoxin module
MRIEVVYALAQQQDLQVMELAPGSTVLDALEASGLAQRLAQPELRRVGVWGKRATAATRLYDGDRVEIYHPLIADPKDIRRKRAANGRSRNT